MVQATLDDIRKNDTARLFRDDADILAIRPSGAPANNRRNANSPLLRGEDEDKPKAFDPNGDSDQAILLRRSGYRQTDEKTREGVYHVQEERSEAKVMERATQAAQAAAASTLYQQAKSWFRTTCRSIGDSISGAVDSVTEFASNAIDKVTTAAGNIWNSVKNGAADIGTSIVNGFDTYIAKPASAAAGWVQEKANTYIVKPASSVIGYAQEKASSAWSWAKSAVGYEDEKPQAAATKPATAQPAARVSAEAQPLAGQKNNVSSGFSLSGAFDSAVDGAKDLLGWSSPAPKSAPGMHR